MKIEMELNWSQIKTATGNAANIPDNIELLRSDNKEIRNNAYWNIDNYAILQGDLHEAAYYIVDPLVKLLHMCRFKTESIELLTEIALGFAAADETITIHQQQVSLLEACRTKLFSHIDFFIQLKGALLNLKDQQLISELIDIIHNFKLSKNAI